MSTGQVKGLKDLGGMLLGYVAMATSLGAARTAMTRLDPERRLVAFVVPRDREREIVGKLRAMLEESGCPSNEIFGLFPEGDGPRVEEVES